MHSSMNLARKCANGSVAATGTLPMMDVFIAKKKAVHASVYQ